ncbi:MAG: Ig-like domain-containing protein, partial [Chitinispirillaceae bacterium]|nr:Ig-like domain-containing protein [Chitinispirillaceae bacterium]
MHRPGSFKTIFFLLGMTSLSIFLLCSLDNKNVVGPLPDAPTIRLIQPSSGSATVADSISSYRIRGTITVAKDLSVTAFSINGASYLDSVSTPPYEFSVTVSLATDTNRFLLATTDSKGKIGADTVTIIRKKEIIPQNQSVLTGTMYRPSSSLMAKRLGKTVMAANAAGQTSPVNTVLPLTGADILFYNADSISTSSIVSTKTDSTGTWKVTVTPGNYFIFAVWFDQQNLELITASIPNVKAEAGKTDTTADKIALVDDIPPMMLTFMDAEAADDNNTFLASDLAQGVPIVITFSEPMNRMSIGDDTTGIILGEIDATDENVSLKNKISLEKIWSATGKELRLVPKSPLAIGIYYKVIIPATIKDLALNKIGSTYYGIFKVTERAELPPFTVKGATIRNGDTITPIKTIEVLFSRPIDGISLNNHSSLSPPRNIFFEAKAATARLSFTSDTGLLPNTTYTLQIKGSVKDLLGDSLSTTYSLTFRTTGAIDSASGQGIKAKVVTFVGTTMEALIAQDIERFAQSFHPLLEVTDISMRDDKEQITKQNLEAFLQARRNDAAIEKKMAIEGVHFPKIYKKSVGTDTVPFKKLIGKTGVGTASAGRYCFIEDIGPGGFKQPQVLDSNGTSITTQVTFKGDTLVAYGSSFIMNIPFNLAFTTTDVNQRDPSYFGKLQNDKTNIEMELVTINTKNTYSVRSVDTTQWNATQKSADVLLDLITTKQQSNSSIPFTQVMAIKMTIVDENARLQVRTLVAKQVFTGTTDLFNQNQTTILNNQNFNLDSLNVTGTKGIELYSPVQKAVKVTVPVTFSWSKVTGVNGYILGISNEISGGTSGLLIFTRDTTVSMGANGSVSGGAVLTIDPSQIRVPLPRFT